MIRIVTILLAAGTMSITAFAAPVAEDAAAIPSAEQDNSLAAQAGKLVKAISTEIGDRANTASAADMEGFIVFVVSQGNYPPEVVDAALAQIGQTATGNLALAVKNVQLAMLKQKLNQGTAAIINNSGQGNGGGNGTFGSNDFSSPSVGTGGGTTNYTT